MDRYAISRADIGKVDTKRAAQSRWKQTRAPLAIETCGNCSELLASEPGKRVPIPDSPGCYDASMNRDLDKMRRRPFFFPLLLPVLVLIALVAAAIWVFDARSTTVIFVVRHAETEPGLDPDPSLSIDGRERAARLARMLAHAQPVRGLDAIFASEYRRTHQTVTPLSETLALPVNLVPSATWNELAARIMRDHRGEYVLVAGNRNTVPQLIEALTGQEVTLRENEYDALFIVFAPQLSKKKVVRVRY